MRKEDKQKKKMKISFEDIPKRGFSFVYEEGGESVKLSFLAHREYKPYGQIANVCLWVDEKGSYWSSGLRSHKAYPCSDAKAKWIIENQAGDRPPKEGSDERAAEPRWELIKAEGKEGIDLIYAFMNGSFKGRKCISVSSTRDDDGNMITRLKVMEG